MVKEKRYEIDILGNHIYCATGSTGDFTFGDFRSERMSMGKVSTTYWTSAKICRVYPQRDHEGPKAALSQVMGSF